MEEVKYQGKRINVQMIDNKWEIVEHPGAVAIVPYVSGGIILVKQFRPAVQQEMLEIPAGTNDVPGEIARDTAIRELYEETGYRPAGPVKYLGAIYTSCGWSTEKVELFDCLASRESEPSEEGTKPVIMSEQAVYRAIRRGDITDAKTIAAFLRSKMDIRI